MKLARITLIALGLLHYPLTNNATETTPADTLNGISFPSGYATWQVISTSQRIDNNTQRYILGNSIAMEAARNGQTSPWPDGSVLAKVVWKSAQAQHWPSAIVPTKFIHSEFMFKDSKRWKATGGWGFARWVGEELKPYGETAEFVQECFSCHQPVESQDFVFTQPAIPPGP